MTVTFEDRLGVMLARDFRVVAIGTHAQGGVILHAGALRKIGASDALGQNQVPESHSPVQAPGEGHRKVHVGKKPVRRSAKYERIDQALCEISEGRPKDHEQVFRSLEVRKVPIPDREPFKHARGWLKGLQQDPHGARAWLSQRWLRLELHPFGRGPKK